MIAMVMAAMEVTGVTVAMEAAMIPAGAGEEEEKDGKDHFHDMNKDTTTLAIFSSISRFFWNFSFIR